jgi:hypothetical protein
MSALLPRAVDPPSLTELELRPSVRVAKLAEAWDCDVTQINRLIDAGELEAHGLGIRARRVYLDSARDYQARKAVAPKSPAAKPGAPATRAPSAVDRTAHRAAMARLRACGVV